MLGICLGMQLLFESSTELGGAEGLGLLAGTVDRLDPGAGKLPHIGWSPVEIERESPMVAGIAGGEPFYFVHSFVAAARGADTIASCLEGERFAAIVGSRQRLRRPVPPREVERGGAADAAQLRRCGRLTDRRVGMT